MRIARGVLVAIAVMVIVAVVAVAAWQLGWFVQEKNVNRAGQVAQQSYARQVGVAGQLSDLATTVSQIDVQISTAAPEQAAALKAQRKAVIDQMCDQAAQLNNTAQPSATASALIAKECS